MRIAYSLSCSSSTPHKRRTSFSWLSRLIGGTKNSSCPLWDTPEAITGCSLRASCLSSRGLRSLYLGLVSYYLRPQAVLCQGVARTTYPRTEIEPFMRNHQLPRMFHRMETAIGISARCPDTSTSTEMRQRTVRSGLGSRRRSQRSPQARGSWAMKRGSPH